jgi:hypothetical protein
LIQINSMAATTPTTTTPSSTPTSMKYLHFGLSSFNLDEYTIKWFCSCDKSDLIELSSDNIIINEVDNVSEKLAILETIVYYFRKYRVTLWTLMNEEYRRKIISRMENMFKDIFTEAELQFDYNVIVRRLFPDNMEYPELEDMNCPTYDTWNVYRILVLVNDGIIDSNIVNWLNICKCQTILLDESIVHILSQVMYKLSEYQHRDTEAEAAVETEDDVEVEADDVEAAEESDTETEDDAEDDDEEYETEDDDEESDTEDDEDEDYTDEFSDTYSEYVETTDIEGYTEDEDTATSNASDDDVDDDVVW